MVKDHEQDVAEFQKEAIGGKDPSLKQFAAKTLPTLESHWQQAREMQRTVQASSARLARSVSLDPFCELTCGFVPSERHSCSQLLGRFRLSLEVKAKVTRAAAVGFPAQQAEEHFFHGPAVRPEKVTLPAARAFTSFASHDERITPQPGSKGIRFFLYGFHRLFFIGFEREPGSRSTSMSPFPRRPAHGPEMRRATRL